MQDQVKTDTGYNYGGTSYQNQERTDSQGNKYTVAIPISSVVSQSPQPQFQTPAPQAPTNYADITKGTANQFSYDLQQQDQELKNSVSDYSQLQDALLGEKAFTAQQNEKLGVNTKSEAYKRKVTELNNLSLQAAEAQQGNISQGRELGSVGSFVAGQANEIERNRSMKALRLSAEAATLKDDLDLAKSAVAEAVDLEYEPKKQALANKEKMFEMNKVLLANATEKEKTAYSRAQDALAKEQKKLDQEIADKKEVNNMITEAIPNAPTSVIANAKKLAESGASKLAVAQALGVYGGDVLKRTLMEEQIKTERAQRRQIEAKTSELGVSLPSGLKATAVVNQPVFQKLRAKEQTQAVALDNLIREINYYKSEVNAGGTSGGVNLFGADSARLSSRLNSLLFAAAQAEGTGALQAADKAVLEQSLPNPTTLGGAFTNLKQGGLDGMNEKLDVQIQKYTDNMGTLGLSPTYNEFSKATSGMLPPPPGEDISTGTDAQGNMQFSLPTATTSTKKY